MPTFEYIAKDAGGDQRVGVMQADSEAAVVRTLSQQALYPVRIEPQAAPKGRMGGARKVRLRELGVMYNQLADLLRAGVPVLRALEILSRATPNPRLSGLIDRLAEDVSAGETLADALDKHPGTFSHLHVAMVRAGEHAGFLEDVLANLSGFIERQDDLRSKVRGAMIYPMVLAIAGTGIVSGILVLLVPKFKDFLGDLALPLPSRILFALSDALINQGLLILGVLVVAAILIVGYVRSESGRRTWDVLKLRIPLAGRAIRMVAITRFCRVLGTMLTNGIPILQALSISKDATGNALMSEAINEAAENVRAGEPLAEPLQRSGLFPLEVVEMIAVGEESNQLEKVLVEVANAVERRTTRQVDTAVSLIEPLMLVFMAALVGLIAIGLLYPILTMSRSIQ